MTHEIYCPYCGSQAELVDGSKVYGAGFRNRFKLYLCPGWPRCDSYVGTHPGGKIPLGRMANVELRHWKKEAHFVFDQLWSGGRMPRYKAYFKLSQYLGKSRSLTHIGMFDIEDCKKVVAFCARYKIFPKPDPAIPEWMKV